jgi:hypothetical protein
MLEDRYGKKPETFVWYVPIFFSALSCLIIGSFYGPFYQGVAILYGVVLLVPAIFLTAISIRLLKGSADLGKRLIYVVAIWIASPILGSAILSIFSLPSFKVFWPALIYTSLYAAIGLIVGVTAQFKALATKRSISHL